MVAAILDEVAFWHSEDSANPDIEIDTPPPVTGVDILATLRAAGIRL